MGHDWNLVIKSVSNDTDLNNVRHAWSHTYNLP